MTLSLGIMMVCIIWGASSEARAQPITAPAALNTNAGTDSGGDYYPTVATDRKGNWVTVWQSDDALGAGLGSDFDVAVALSTDEGTTWTSPAALNTNAATDVDGDYFPYVATSGTGTWLVVWFTASNEEDTVQIDGDILFARSNDNGATWSAPAALNTNAASDTGSDGSPCVTTNSSGSWIAVWTSTEDLGGTLGIDGDILFARSTDDGLTWTAPAPSTATLRRTPVTHGTRR